MRASGKVGAATNLGFLHMRASGADGGDRNDFTVTRLSRRKRGRIRNEDIRGQEHIARVAPLVAYRGFWDFGGYHESGNLHLESWWIWKSGADVGRR